MSEFGVQIGDYYNIVGESIYIYNVTKWFVYFNVYDDCGDSWQRNLKRKVHLDPLRNQLFVKINNKHIHCIEDIE